MAATEQLKLNINGDTSGAVNSLKALEAELARLQKLAKDPSLTFNQLKTVSGSISKAQSEIKSLGSVVGKTSKDFTGFSRVLQDLPFGFTAISNNLTQLVPAAGAAGLAFSALVAAFTFAQTGLANWTRGMGGSKQTLEDLREKLEEYVKSLDSLNEARVRGNQGAQEELVKLKTLYDATQNQNISIKKRKELVDELQSQYPKYFANISDETILAGGAADKYKQLATAILASAKARAAQDAIVDIQKQVLVVEQQITSAIGKQANAIVALNKEKRKSANSGTNADGSATGAGVMSFFNLKKAEGEAQDAQKDVNKLYAQRNDLLKQALNLTKEVTAITEQNPDALLDPTGNIDKPKNDKKSEFLFQFFPFDTNGKIKPEQKAQLLNASEKFTKEFGDILKGVNFTEGALSSDDVLENAKAFWANFKKGIVQFKPAPIKISPGEIVEFEFTDDSIAKKFVTAMQFELDKASGEEVFVFKPDVDRALLLEKFTKAFKEVGQKLPKEVKLGETVMGVDQATNLKALEDALNKLLGVAQDKMANFQQIITSIGVEAFAGLGEAIAAGVTGGDIGGAFKNLFTFIGSALQDFGKQVIAFSSIMVALKKAIATFNPAASLIAGIALVAIGGVLKNLKPKGFATGGVIPSGFPNDSYYARLTSGERVLTPAQNKEWERGSMGRANMAFPEYLPAVSITANQLDLFYKRSNRFVTNTH